ncbi:MAG TPA: hypothetical protein VHO29_06435 [Marmoricola sp.]|nr:hypothetical protein [Marmoricola sp.]
MTARPGWVDAAHARASGRRKLLTLALAGVLFVGILTLRLLGGTVNDAYSMFYALPVALLATTFGMRAGSAAGLLGVGLIGVWTTVDHIHLTPTGWASRVVPILLLGVLVGEATDRLRAMEADRRRLEAAALLHRQAIEINDSLVQGMAAAKWSLEAGSVDVGLRLLDDTITRAHDLVSGLIRSADMGGHTEALPDTVSSSTVPITES